MSPTLTEGRIMFKRVTRSKVSIEGKPHMVETYNADRDVCMGRVRFEICINTLRTTARVLSGGLGPECAKVHNTRIFEDGLSDENRIRYAGEVLKAYFPESWASA